MTLRSSQELSREKEAELHYSIKKFRESHHLDPFSSDRPNDSRYPSSSIPNGPKLSFKEKLVKEIPRAYVQAFNFSAYLDDDMESNIEVETLREGPTTVKLSKEFK